MDLYIATRSDAPHLLKVGRSSNAHSRCRQLQNGHCFRIHVLAIFGGMGACEAPVHRALKQYRLCNSEWFDIDLLTTVETIQEAQPQPQRTRRINLEAQALKHLKAHKTLKSSRYPHLNSSPA